MNDKVFSVEAYYTKEAESQVSDLLTEKLSEKIGTWKSKQRWNSMPTQDNPVGHMKMSAVVMNTDTLQALIDFYKGDKPRLNLKAIVEQLEEELNK